MGLLPHLSGLVIEGVHDQDDGVRIEARVRAERMACPGCERGSDRVHSRYRRRLADAPIGAQTVVIQLRVRRFFGSGAISVKPVS